MLNLQSKPLPTTPKHSVIHTYLSNIILLDIATFISMVRILHSEKPKLCDWKM